MNKLLEIYTLPRLNHGEIKNLNRSKSNENIEAVIKKLATKRAQDQMAFLEILSST